MLVCCSEIENKMMPVDDAVSPMQGDRYPTGYIRRTDAAASGHDLAAEKLLHPDAMGGAGTRQGQAFLLFRGVQPDPVDFLYSQTDRPGTPAAYHLFHLQDSIAAIHRKVETGELLSGAVPDRQPGTQHITQTVRLSGDHVPGLLPLPRASCEGGAAV